MDGGKGSFADDRFGQCQTFRCWGRDRWVVVGSLPAPATNVKQVVLFRRKQSAVAYGYDNSVECFYKVITQDASV